MISAIRQLAEHAVLTLASAVLFVTFHELNDWIFSSLEYREDITWVFLPAGFRVILVLVLGLRGACGLMLGSWFIDSATWTPETWFFPFLNGVVSGLTPWLVMKSLTCHGWLSPQLENMTAQRLLQLTLLFSAASAGSEQLVGWLFVRPEANIWIDVWPMLIGNALGALLMLYVMKFVLDQWGFGRRVGSD